MQRDPTGSGIVDTDIVKQGWVPAGCLLETNVPVASAIAEATAAKNGSTSESSPDTVISKTPILPLSIISTSFPGIALMDYSKKGDEELDLVKDDALRVFKRYNHWSYVRTVIIFHLFASSTPSTGCQRSGRRSWMGTGMIAFPFFLSLASLTLLLLFISHGSLVKFRQLPLYLLRPIRRHRIWMTVRHKFLHCLPHSRLTHAHQRREYRDVHNHCHSPVTYIYHFCHHLSFISVVTPLCISFVLHHKSGAYP